MDWKTIAIRLKETTLNMMLFENFELVNEIVENELIIMSLPLQNEKPFHRQSSFCI